VVTKDDGLIFSFPRDTDLCQKLTHLLFGLIIIIFVELRVLLKPFLLFFFALLLIVTVFSVAHRLVA
jgi:hypothetical protein